MGIVNGDVSTGRKAPRGLAATPPAQPPPLLRKTEVKAALGRLDGVVWDAMNNTGVPGMAVSVLHQDQVVYLKGFGVCQIGKPDAVGPDTVFQLASVSKPLASTVVAGVVGQKIVSWDDPVSRHDSSFALKDPWITGHLTLADLFAHRSGLPDHAGDLLEDLGYDRAYILLHLRDQPLAPFRTSYAYTNFGLTEAAQAVAKAKGTTWEELSRDVLYQPLGMSSTSSRFADYESAANKALTHVRVNGVWQPKYTRNPDAQSPAGGASSTARDMAQWVRLQLSKGELAGRQIIDAASLARTHLPAIVSRGPRAPAGRSEFYGLGWNVSYDDQGRLKLSHSGAFALGAATTVVLLPSEQLGIVVLTNGEPTGAAEAVANGFLDAAQNGRPTVDWLSFFVNLFTPAAQNGHSGIDYSKPPPQPAPAHPDATYVGSYDNSHYGTLVVTTDNGGFLMQLGPKSIELALRHYDGDTFTYETVGENAVGLAGVVFTVEANNGRAMSVKVTNLDVDGLGRPTGLGTFTSS
jgi:CubicO group peptidase (beta-lactamase class C family)